ncbi:hypothetical protein NECAME_09373 [Necator americanus]|uniref:ShKT domain-containing protein n=1 Tax=Necator americanus TaxID=51031 RepID=W2TGI4_NECAM|nr:hypothetical protein NECAME_09373 [Necator americanus]ETN80137.1 hypothetical protein NECAME_09373 [Necator americanus]
MPKTTFGGSSKLFIQNSFLVNLEEEKRNSSDISSEEDDGKRSDLPVSSFKESIVSGKKLIKKVTSQTGKTTSLPQSATTSSTEKRWTPYKMNCATEYDDKGELCKEWAAGGLCAVHRPTMFLFCRKTCLCVGPGA